MRMAPKMEPLWMPCFNFWNGRRHTQTVICKYATVVATGKMDGTEPQANITVPKTLQGITDRMLTMGGCAVVINV
jgi:hypothetical protein